MRQDSGAADRARHCSRSQRSTVRLRGGPRTGAPGAGAASERPCLLWQPIRRAIVAAMSLDPRRRHRSRPPEGRRHRPFARLLPRHPRLRRDAADRRRGRVHLGRRLPPPPRPEHVGVARRLAAAAGHDRPLPRRDPLPGPARARRRAAAAGRGRLADRRRHRPRRLRGDLPARSRTATAIELYRDRPEEEWPRPADGGEGVAMFNAPLDLQALLAEATMA